MATARKFTRFLTYIFLLGITALVSMFIGGKKSEQNNSLVANLNLPAIPAAHADNPGGGTGQGDTGQGGTGGTGGCADCSADDEGG